MNRPDSNLPSDAERETNDLYYEDPEPTILQDVIDLVVIVAVLAVVVWGLFWVFGS